MKFNSKTGYYLIVIGIGVVSFILSALILRPHNQSPYKTTINQALLYYGKTINKTNDAIVDKLFGNKSFPFDIILETSSDNEFKIKFNEKENKLILQNSESLDDTEKQLINDVLSKVSLDKNVTNLLNFSLLDGVEKIPVYSIMNIFFCVNEEENLTDYRKYIETISKYYDEFLSKTKIKIVIKYIYYDNKNGIEGNKELYKDFNQLNPTILFEELLNQDNLNIIFYKSLNNRKSIYPRYNKDINSFLYAVNYEEDLIPKLINSITNINNLNKYISIETLNSNLFQNGNLNEIKKIYYSPNCQYHMLFISTIKNLEKISRIFPLYETIKTNEQVKERLIEINKIVVKLVQKKFSIETIDLVRKIYINTQFLMESNELVVYEHYFSDQFKLGVFLPIMIPILYAIVKAVRGIKIKN